MRFGWIHTSIFMEIQLTNHNFRKDQWTVTALQRFQTSVYYLFIALKTRPVCIVAKWNWVKNENYVQTRFGWICTSTKFMDIQLTNHNFRKDHWINEQQPRYTRLSCHYLWSLNVSVVYSKYFEIFLPVMFCRVSSVIVTSSLGCGPAAPRSHM